MVATDSAEVATDPPEARQRTGRLVARRTRRREIVAAALKETALRSTVRLSGWTPGTTRINRPFRLTRSFFSSKMKSLRYSIYARTNFLQCVKVTYEIKFIYVFSRSMQKISFIY